MKNEMYYYGILTKQEKAAYRMIYNGISKRALNIVVPVLLSPQEVQDVYLKVLYDNPIFYYINQTVIRMTGTKGYYVLLPEYLYTSSEIDRINQDIARVLKKIDAKARTMLSNEFRLEKYLHDSVVKSVAYDYESLKKTDCYNAQSIVGAFLDKKAVCEGIAKAFKLLCNEYSMKCIVVLGKADPSGRFDGNSYHAWNLVKVGNGSYHVDVTWDNMYDQGLEHISYDYFNVTTEDIAKDHQPMGKLPICKDVGLNYFHSTKSFINTYQELFDLIKQRFNAKSIMFKVEADSLEFPTMDSVKLKTYMALNDVMLIKKSEKRAFVLFNDAQRIGKIIFS